MVCWFYFAKPFVCMCMQHYILVQEPKLSAKEVNLTVCHCRIGFGVTDPYLNSNFSLQAMHLFSSVYLHLIGRTEIIYVSSTHVFSLLPCLFRKVAELETFLSFCCGEGGSSYWKKSDI